MEHSITIQCSISVLIYCMYYIQNASIYIYVATTNFNANKPHHGFVIVTTDNSSQVTYLIMYVKCISFSQATLVK